MNRTGKVFRDINLAILDLFGKILLAALNWSYFRWYPLNENLGKALFDNDYEISPKKKKRINDIRLKNVIATFWSQTGALLALFVTLFLGLFSINGPVMIQERAGAISTFLKEQWSVIPDIPLFSIDILAYTIFFIPLIITTVIFFDLSGIILRRIITHLSPEEYTKITVSSLDRAELLTFLAYKNWGLIERFLREIELTKPMEWDELTKYILEKTNNKNQDENSYEKKIKAYLNNNFREIQQCIFMVRGSYDRLGINKRELTNHVLKFSPAMFYISINTVLENLRTLEYFDKIDKESPVKEHYLRDFCYLIYDLSSKRKPFLEELMVFDNTHKYIIGMSSHISTSLSLKSFIRGISKISSDYYFENTIEEERQEKYIKELKSVLHRSKAHCGVDLLISLENFENKYLLNCTGSINEGNSKPGPITSILQTLRVEKISKIPKGEDLREKAEILKTIRQEYWDNIYLAQKDMIFKKFHYAVDGVAKTIKKEEVSAYFIVFGYSELVRKCLRSVATLLDSCGIKVFILLDNDLKALDTRSFLYELKKDFIKAEKKNIETSDTGYPEITDKEYSLSENDGYKGGPVLKSLTGGDKLIKALVNKDDRVYFMAGAEVYDQKTGKLLHTNRYQSRVEGMIKDFWKHLTHKPRMWVIAEKYKIYADYPRDTLTFGAQFYQDYYETLDLYDLQTLFHGESNIEVITDQDL